MSNGGSGSGSSPPSNTLKFSPFKFHFTFVDTWFDTMVWINDESDRMKTGGEDVPISLTLMHVNGDHKHITSIEQVEVANQSLLVIDPTKPLVIKSGRATLRCRICDTSMNHDNRMFCLMAHANTSHTGVGTIPPAFSTPITIIKNQLRLDPNMKSAWENEWYKDEGGRDKCITVKVQLLDKDNQLVTNRKVPLSVTLQYDSGMRVAQQDILKISPDSNMSIENGQAIIRARIEQVSRSHQGQSFQIFVGPDVDKDPLISDISPVVSQSVTVRSKINKKRKAATMKANANAMKTMQRGGDDMRHHRIDAPPAKMLATEATHYSARFDDQRYMQRSMAASASYGHAGDASSPLETSLTTVLKWISNVLGVLQRVKWKQIGYEHPDTLTGERGRPMYEMHNPNEMVDEILTEYRAQVMDNLDMILKQLEPIIATENAGDDALPKPQMTEAAVVGHSLKPQPAFGGMGMPNLDRQHSTSFLPGDDTMAEGMIEMPYLVEAYSDDASAIEERVEFIVAKILTVQQSKVGFPAFDANRNLIGFYRELNYSADCDRDPNGLNFMLAFMPLDHVRTSAQLTQQNLNAGSRSLNEQIQKKSKSVFARSNFQDDLANFKDQAARYYANKESSNAIDMLLENGFFDI